MPEVEFHWVGGENTRERSVAIINDDAATREALEGAAIPRCKEWREANPEEGSAAPYCCSPYCGRCTGLRALDGEAPLTPNMWMDQDV